ncbi:MAG: toxin-antitoxin system HicB family antitoxin [Anaerolineales bacterium]|nr:toxin-antitoxin system HicB family antitoxin [Anaerolineales bacterium]
MNQKTIKYFLNLPYTIEVVRESDPDEPGWVARVVELQGCITQGDDFAELGEMVQDAMRGWIEVALEDGQEIPEPRLEEDYSGKFVVRVPKSLHRQLVIEAEREGVSLNQFINVALASAVSTPRGRAEAGQAYEVRYSERSQLETQALHERTETPGEQ